MHKAKRLEIIIERMALSRAATLLRDSDLTGYTVISALGGGGRNHTWHRDADLSAARDMVVVIAIGDDAKISQALTSLHDLVDQHIGVLSVGEVEVLRPERF